MAPEIGDHRVVVDQGVVDVDQEHDLGASDHRRLRWSPAPPSP